MKIALVIDKYVAQGGGAERWTDHHARSLLAEGHEVHLFARRFQGPPGGAVAHQVKVERGNAMQQWRLEFGREVESMRRRERFDVIHDMGDGWYADVLMPHHGPRQAVYRQVSRLLPQPHRWFRPLAYHLLPRYRQFRTVEHFQYADSPGLRPKQFIAVSPMVARLLQQYHGVSNDRLHVVYNGIDTARFRPEHDTRHRNVCRNELGIGDRTAFLLVALNPRLKGLDTILQALVEMPPADRDRSAMIFVGLDYKGQYQQKIERLGLAGCVRILPPREDVAELYHAADVYIQPSYYDSCSLTVLEAMACGLPVITTRWNGVCDLLNASSAGVLLDEPGCSRQLQQAMTRLLDPTVRAQIAPRARAVVEPHTWEANFRAVLDVYRRVTGETPPKAPSSPLPTPTAHMTA